MIHFLKLARPEAALLFAVAALAASSASAQTPLVQASPAQGQTTIWGCDAPSGHSCSFALFPQVGAIRKFNIPAGQRYSVADTRPGFDAYFVSIDVPAPANLTECAAIQKRGIFCKRAVVGAKYNN